MVKTQITYIFRISNVTLFHKIVNCLSPLCIILISVVAASQSSVEGTWVMIDTWMCLPRTRNGRLETPILTRNTANSLGYKLNDVTTLRRSIKAESGLVPHDCLRCQVKLSQDCNSAPYAPLCPPPPPPLPHWLTHHTELIFRSQINQKTTIFTYN